MRKHLSGWENRYSPGQVCSQASENRGLVAQWANEINHSSLGSLNNASWINNNFHSEDNFAKLTTARLVKPLS